MAQQRARRGARSRRRRRSGQIRRQEGNAGGSHARLIDQTTGWIENGPWSMKKGKQAAKERASPTGAYSEAKLEEWEEKLLKRSRKLRKMGTKKRHRLRLFNK